MKRAFVPYLVRPDGQITFEILEEMLRVVDPLMLDEAPWPAYSYKPKVSVKIAYTEDHLVLGYWVQEQHPDAVFLNTNDPVYQDSCVEFFASFDGQHYYNFEFNRLGTRYGAFGLQGGSVRQELPPTVLEEIDVFTSGDPKATDQGDFQWDLLLYIPISVFIANRFGSLAAVCCTANFYKCGDHLPVPHYLSWNPIHYPSPNFHLPSCFGVLEFE